MTELKSAAAWRDVCVWCAFRRRVLVAVAATRLLHTP